MHYQRQHMHVHAKLWGGAEQRRCATQPHVHTPTHRTHACKQTRARAYTHTQRTRACTQTRTHTHTHRTHACTQSRARVYTHTQRTRACTQMRTRVMGPCISLAAPNRCRLRQKTLLREHNSKRILMVTWAVAHLPTERGLPIHRSERRVRGPDRSVDGVVRRPRRHHARVGACAVGPPCRCARTPHRVRGQTREWAASCAAAMPAGPQTPMPRVARQRGTREDEARPRQSPLQLGPHVR